jgi:hypothetical protein
MTEGKPLITALWLRFLRRQQWVDSAPEGIASADNAASLVTSVRDGGELFIDLFRPRAIPVSITNEI